MFQNKIFQLTECYELIMKVYSLYLAEKHNTKEKNRAQLLYSNPIASKHFAINQLLKTLMLKKREI